MVTKGRRARVLEKLSNTDRDQLDDQGYLYLRVVGSMRSNEDNRITRTIAERDESSNPSIHPALEDLAYQIMGDIRQACFALDDPELDYPGVDEGIEPVSDDHVALVIWALQRELDRELRDRVGGQSPAKLPAVPLGKLPWRVQRALAERRRLRFQQWGIGRKEWESNRWHPDNVPEDPEWEPTWKR